jgi:4-amino-4-deoxy-L-arabinose transferase-like glycosyltransferase
MLAKLIQKNVFWLAILLSLAVYLILTNLDSSFLWQDEAETACVSQTILQNGIPKGTDGLNFFSQQEGREYGANYEWKLHPWFQFYWQSVFFALFGVGTFVARLPFALFGIASVAMIYFAALSIWQDKRAAVWSALLMLASVSFLLLVRQARYYAPAQFFTIYAIWALFELIGKGERKAAIHFGIATFFLFHSQYLFALNFWVGSWIYVYFRARTAFKPMAISTIIVAAICLPFLWWLLQSNYGGTMVINSLENQRLGNAFSKYSVFLFSYIFSPIWLVVPAVVWWLSLMKKAVWVGREESPQLFLFLLMAINLLNISLLSQEYYPRYLCALMPFAFLLQGRFMLFLQRLHIGLALAAFAIVLISGDMRRFLPELHQKYIGPIRAIATFLQEKAKPNDTIMISFGDLPLKFYLPEHKIYGGLTGEDLTPALNAKYVILRKNAISQMDLKVHNFMSSQLKWDRYQAYKLNVEDLPFENREVVNEHYFATPKVVNPIIIYERMD